MIRIRFTDHAIERYIERVRPAYDTRQAFREMQNLKASGVGVTTTEPPCWYGFVAETQDATHYLHVGEDVCLPLARPVNDPRTDFIALTTAVRGSLPPLTRESRNRNRAGRGAAKRGRKVAGKKVTRKPERRGGRGYEQD